VIEELGLGLAGTSKAVLGDGSQVAIVAYTGFVEWFGESRKLEVIANRGDYPLLGVGLLAGHDLHVSYRTGIVKIE
jgi:predicted aspartyl protease